MRLLIGLVLCALAGSAMSACPSGKTVFECTTPAGTQIRVCDKGTHLSYAFGRSRHPDVAFHAPRATASTYQWRGTGETATYSVSLPHGRTLYTVFHTAERKSPSVPHPQVFAGVEVSVDDEQRALVYCDLSQPFTNGMKNIDLRDPTK